MVDKLREYQGTIGQLHTIRDNVKSRIENWKERQTNIDPIHIFKRNLVEKEDKVDDSNFDFSHLYRKKTRTELIRLCATVAGIEFSYAAITAFSSPILLENGVPQRFMSMVYSLSAILGFLLSPLTGSISDRCDCQYGRRRIFIIIFSILEIIGLLLIPNSKSFGHYLDKLMESNVELVNEFTPDSILNDTVNAYNDTISNSTMSSVDCLPDSAKKNCSYAFVDENIAQTSVAYVSGWVIILSIIGIVIADYCADALQNPSRAYLLDVCSEEDHTRGLSMFTVLAGCGGSVGYLLGSIDWDHLYIGTFFGGHVKTVFWMTIFLFSFCVILSITTLPEVPLEMLPAVEEKARELYYRNINEGTNEKIRMVNLDKEADKSELQEDSDGFHATSISHREIKQVEKGCHRGSLRLSLKHQQSVALQETAPTLGEYLKSIINLPYSIRILLFTNIMCWMSHVSYSLYFTDYVGAAVFGGDPTAEPGTKLKENYEIGIRFACIGMSIYSLSCLVCSLFMENIIKKFGLRKVYMINISIDTFSMLVMFYLNSKFGAIVFSFSSGILYCTIFTIPYIIIARYHTLNVFEVDSKGDFVPSKQIRGLGTDISIIGSSVFIAQFILSFFMGSVVSWYGSTRIVPLICCVLSFVALFGTTQIVYLDL